jgi:hypothetical protein
VRPALLGLCLAALAAPGGAAAETAMPQPPWVRLVPPDRFCIRFGGFDWLSYIREIDAMAKTRHAADARASARSARRSGIWGAAAGASAAAAPKAPLSPI